MLKTKEGLSDEFAMLCNEAFEAWRRDKIRAGWAHTRCTQGAFCAEYSFKPTSWSGWTKGRIPRELENIRALANCPYIGDQIFRVLQLHPETGDGRLRSIQRAWLQMNEEEKQTLYNFLKDREMLALVDED